MTLEFEAMLDELLYAQALYIRASDAGSDDKPELKRRVAEARVKVVKYIDRLES